MIGVQAAAAADLPSRKSDCVNHQRVDYNGNVVRDANGNPVPCGAWAEPAAYDPGIDPLYLGAGALLIGGGIAAAVVTSSSNNNNGGAGGGGSQQALLYTLLLNNAAHPPSP
ncbi:MAG: hypothetical protein WB816_07390 [Methylocystis sp.]